MKSNLSMFDFLIKLKKLAAAEPKFFLLSKIVILFLFFFLKSLINCNVLSDE